MLGHTLKATEALQYNSPNITFGTVLAGPTTQANCFEDVTWSIRAPRALCAAGTPDHGKQAHTTAKTWNTGN